MADIADVLDALEQIAIAACYPNGTDSVSGKPIDIAQGWPLAEDLDKGLAAGETFVSIYAVPSSTSKLPVPLPGSSDGVIIAPAHGMTATPTASGFTLAGEPGAGEYVTAIVNGRPYSALAGAGDTVQILAAELAQAIAVDLPGTTRSDASVSIPVFHSLIVRIGAPATVGTVIDRQKQNVTIGVWAPNPSDRAVVGRPIQVAVAKNLTITMPDTSEAILISQGVNLIDKNMNELAYRRDLTVQVQWDTLDTYPAYEVTSVNMTIDAGLPVTVVQ